MKSETVQINLLGDVFGLLSFRNFATMATWRNDFFSLQSVFTHVASINANLWEQKKRLHKKTIYLPQDWFGTLIWLPFHCFGTSIWPLWRHVKTPYYRMCYRLRKKTLLNENFIHGVRASQVLISTRVRYIQWTVCYFRAIKRSPINIPRKAGFF